MELYLVTYLGTPVYAAWTAEQAQGFVDRGKYPCYLTSIQKIELGSLWDALDGAWAQMYDREIPGAWTSAHTLADSVGHVMGLYGQAPLPGKAIVEELAHALMQLILAHGPGDPFAFIFESILPSAGWKDRDLSEQADLIQQVYDFQEAAAETAKNGK